MNKHQKLELTWIGKDEQPRLEPRILIEDAERSYGVLKHQTTPNPSLTKGLLTTPNSSLTKEGSKGMAAKGSPPILGGDKGVVSFSDNMLIHGDNLLALKALEQDFAGQIKCACIDPPYNTGNAFEHYDDGLEHSIWLSLMKPRIEILHKLLRNDGTLWIFIDDDESHYLKVLCDEVFGRKNFVANVIWEKKHTRQNDAKWLSDNHDHILCFAKNKEIWRPNLLPRTDSMDERFSNPDNDLRGPWASQPLQVKTPSQSCIYEIVTPAGRKVMPPKGRSWQFKKERYEELVKDNRIWFGQNGDNVPRIKKFLSEVQQGLVSTTLWRHEEVGHNQDAKMEMKQIFPDASFSTPKPAERGQIWQLDY